MRSRARRIGQVLGARDGGLRAQIRPDPAGGPCASLNIGSPRRRVCIVAVFVAGGDHQHAEADDLVQTVHDLLRRARVLDAGGQTLGDTKSLLDLAQGQQAAIRRQQAAVETSHDGLPPTGDRPGSGSIESIMAGVLRRTWRGLASTTKSYAVSAT